MWGLTHQVSVYMAGDIETAKRWLRRHAYERGLCITVTPSTFIYTGGEETGFGVGLLNYPRFPAEPSDINLRADEIARSLLVECCQKTALVVTPHETEWIQVTPPGVR